ncbi:hypothetical protein [Limnoglobus roseus]|uniref:Uncharacterized protein n=1 Tax=Limnoglobus roseus TaxID=2598579 RepID=A0A5C1AM84_9BACT|nr:hypothetical protein [Limnoglobus roseus]QEL18294.1 hypothetical protein PX52LOC_05313 [Limnoglobus roseus]
MTAVKPRRRDRLCSLPNVRYTVEGRFQARIWIGATWGSISLGLYPTEELAASASREVLRHLCGHLLDPLSVWSATRRAIATGHVRPTVLPKFVILRGGEFFTRFTTRAGVAGGPYPTAVQACAAAVDARLQAINARRSSALASSN